MNWTSVEELSANAPLPEGYRHEALTRTDIPALVRAFADRCPGIAVGKTSCHLRGVVKRVYEAIYTKALVDEEDFVRPRYQNMTPKTTAFFRPLYPGKASAAQPAVNADASKEFH